MKSADVVRTPFGILKATVAEWTADRAPRLAAALAYHTLLAIAPLLVISVGIAGFVLGPRATRDRLVEQVFQYTGSADIADLMETILDGAARPAASTLATVIGLVVLLWGASNLFSVLKTSLNDIWGVSPSPARPVVYMLLNRAVALAMVFGVGFLLLATLVLTTVLAAAAERINSVLPVAPLVTQVVAFALFYVLTLLIFGAIYRYVPDVRLAWRDVWSGAAVTAFLFSIGRLLIGLYLGFSTVASAYGAAGSLVVVLLWIFYSAQIFFFGAEFTQVFARTHGTRWREQDKLDAPVEPPGS